MSRFTQITQFKDYALPSNHSDGYAEEIMIAGERQLSYAVHKHSQVFVVHLTLTFPQSVLVDCYTDNSCFQFFVVNYVRYLGFNKYDPGYLWVREIAPSSMRPHYHLLLFLNGHNIQLFDSMEISQVRMYWQRALQRFFGIYEPVSPVHVATDNFKVFRSCPETFRRAIEEKVSYISKLYSKDFTGRYVRTWGQSQIK